MARPTNSKLTHSMIHYLMAVHALVEHSERAKASDIARFLGFARSTVTMSLRSLRRKKLLEVDEQGNFRLSKQGHSIVHRGLANYELWYHFFATVLKVPTAAAHHNACLLEHIITGPISEALYQFLRQLSSWPKDWNAADFLAFKGQGEIQKGNQARPKN